MSPKAMKYRANSIIYFVGDQSEKIYILNAGKVSLNYMDIETGEDVHDLIKTGEFFGVRSALGHYPREETALVLADATVIGFSTTEFEQLVSKNSRVILKMLRVFSNQLRRIHRQVQNLLYVNEHVNPETGLYQISRYYLKNKKYQEAIYVLARYLAYYPNGNWVDTVRGDLDAAERMAGNPTENGERPVSANKPFTDGQNPERPDKAKEISDVAKEYYNAISHVTKQNYEEALAAFKMIVEKNEDSEYVSKSWYEIGRCFFFLNKFDKSIQIFTNLIQKYPKHPDLNEAIYFIAKSNEQSNEPSKAIGLYKKLLSMTPQTDSLYRKVKKSLRTMEGEA